MKVVIFLLSSVVFLAGMAAFAYADVFEGWAAIAVFTAGVLAASAAFAIPFHLLEKFD
ncbi:hypothetical protein [Salinibacterium sp. ZJ77]|uniref:hypothetical protein n=1 Tax=Salinibacterium sp. ZJ77 TaxID=2708337 RepID=UPI00141E86F7|nr:hypothetical protein [Salinibacterium sp. ZJ77]